MKIFIKITVTVILFSLLLSQISFNQLLTKIHEIKIELVCFCIFALFLLNIIITIRWRIILLNLDLNRSNLILWWLTMIGAFFNQFLPGGIGGDLFRITYLRSSGVQLQKAVFSVIIDRIVGFLCLIILILLGAPYLILNSNNEMVLTTLLILVILLAVAILTFIRLDMVNKALNKFPFFINLINSQSHLVRSLNSVVQCAKYLRILLQNWPDGFIVLFISFVNQIIISLVMFLLLRALGGNIDFFAVVFVLPIVLLISMIPISLAGWGIREGGMVLVFALLGVPKEISLGASIIFGICFFLSTLPGAFLWLIGQKKIYTKTNN